MTAADPIADEVRCPCGSGETYGACCAPVHRGERVAPTAVQLMRSRYSAFAVRDAAYLAETWHRSTRPDEIVPADDVRWLSLDVLDAVAGGPFDSRGEVEFRAIYRDADGRGEVHERSRFVRESGRWSYVDGDVRSA